ncbi:hypothetical protein [Sporocytophaga myxococcoides]|uniref:hypothetical protein n=1 Tax=Sporocytophaga myxococcoides TaxID=153721 RepID=UPI0004241820|nr:hypothetical protein [Sporocytophaga myxococcoides]
MIEFDTKTLERLKNPKTKVEDKLFLFARNIEEKNKFEIQPNYWEDAFELMESKERIFYKVWLWMNYVEWESFVRPIPEFKCVFGVDKEYELNKCLEDEIELDNLYKFYTLGGKAGEILLDWAIKELQTNFYNV